MPGSSHPEGESLFDPDTEAALDAIADELELAERLRPIDSHRWRQPSDLLGPRQSVLPALQLEDVSAIPFLDNISGVEQYQHRARVRARDGDLFAAVTPPAEGYEDYCRDLGLGSPDLVLADAVGHPLQVARACARGASLERVAERAAAAGGLVIHPYMSIEPVWELARAIAEAARVPVTVIGPPPVVTWIANDKVLFSRVVAAVLGDAFLADGEEARDPEEAGGALARLARKHPVVGIKRARCASAMGNRIYRRATLGGGDSARCLEVARSFAAETRWPADEGAVVVEWLEAAASPSTQLWIPPRGQGPVRLDGVYEQILVGETQVFLGSRPSRLSPALNRRIGAAACLVASALQRFGYTGRCSFDHLVVGDGPEARIVFTECNGRWGGTSTPMSLVDRLAGSPRPFYRAQDVISPDLVGARFTELKAALESELYHPRRGGRFILYNVGPLEPHGKLDVIAFGGDAESADAAVLEILPRLLGVELTEPAGSEM
jgi:hypothetical protein